MKSIVLSGLLLASVTRPAVATPSKLSRLFDPPFTREECESYLRGPQGEKLRLRSATWLSKWRGIPLAVTTNLPPPTRPEAYSTDFAIFIAPRGTTLDEMREIFNETDARRQAWQAASLNPTPPPPPVPLSPLQAMSLGVTAADEIPVDALETTVGARDRHTLLLRTKHGRRVVGERALDLRGVQLGYEGDPYHWIFTELSAEGQPPPSLTLRRFWDDEGAYLLRPTESTRPDLYFLIRVIAEPGRPGSIDSVEIEVYTARRVEASLLATTDLRQPSSHHGGQVLKFTPIGLRLMTDLE